MMASLDVYLGYKLIRIRPIAQPWRSERYGGCHDRPGEFRVSLCKKREARIGSGSTRHRTSLENSFLKTMGYRPGGRHPIDLSNTTGWRLTPKDQTAHKAYPKSSENCPGWILSHVAICIFPQRACATSGIAGGLIAFALMPFLNRSCHWECLFFHLRHSRRNFFG